MTSESGRKALPLGLLGALRDSADRIAECDRCKRTRALWAHYESGHKAYYCRPCVKWLLGILSGCWEA